MNLQPHPGYVWLKSGYSEAIPWRKVGLIKQRNVDLTTDGLWAMPLNEGWVPVKARSPPCLKKAMLTVTVILNKNG